ncbi:hypothetical protein DWX76_05065 [Clostridium sp. AF21-20LB]|nr:hypothetical protein DWX76_05065 [Clostridium sp. AF21-20LB]
MVLFETKKTAVKQLALQRFFFFHRELRPMKKNSARMRTRAKQKTVASDRARRPNVPRHILFYI